MPNCIFCNNSKVSKEHLWGKWWKDYYPPTESHMKYRGGHTITKVGQNGELVESVGQFSNVGAAISATTKVVCGICNNTWMSQIEGRMKESFHRIYFEGVERVSADSSYHITAWMYLKFCLFDRAYEDQGLLYSKNLPDSHIINQQINSIRLNRWLEFHEGKTIPEDFHFFIARSKDGNKLGSFNHIPQVYVKKGNGLKVQLFDTCMFFNGSFIGIITSHQELSTYLISYKNHQSNRPIRQLLRDPLELPIDCVIHGSGIEERVLSLLEKKRGTPYRRNFT